MPTSFQFFDYAGREHRCLYGSFLKNACIPTMLNKGEKCFEPISLFVYFLTNQSECEKDNRKSGKIFFLILGEMDDQIWSPEMWWKDTRFKKDCCA